MKKNILKRSLSLLAGAVLAAVLAVSAPAAGVHAAQAGLDQVSVSASSTVKVSPDMAQGLAGNEEFQLDIFKANYPDLVKNIGGDNATCYVYYLIYGKEQGLVADHRI